MLEEFLKPLGISQSAFAVRLGVPFPRLNEIIRGEQIPRVAWKSATRPTLQPRKKAAAEQIEGSRVPVPGTVDQADRL